MDKPATVETLFHCLYGYRQQLNLNHESSNRQGLMVWSDVPGIFLKVNFISKWVEDCGEDLWFFIDLTVAQKQRYAYRFGRSPAGTWAASTDWMTPPSADPMETLKITIQQALGELNESPR